MRIPIVGCDKKTPCRPAKQAPCLESDLTFDLQVKREIDLAWSTWATLKRNMNSIATRTARRAQKPPAAAQLALAGYARRAEPPRGGSTRLANCAAAVRRWSEPARAPRKSKNAHPNQRDTKFGEARPSRGVHQTVVGVRTPYSSFFATPTSEVPPGGSPGGRSAKFPASRPADVDV